MNNTERKNSEAGYVPGFGVPLYHIIYNGGLTVFSVPELTMNS